MHGIALQPIVRVDGQILGHEILIRRRGTDGRWRLPADFLPAPSASHPGRWMADMYVADRVRLDDQLRSLPGKLFINVSHATLEREEIFRQWVAILRTAVQRKLSQIVAEFSEDTNLPDGVLADRVADIRALGVATAMDDFGTGNHRLDLLKEPLWDWVKIWWPASSLDERELTRASEFCHGNDIPIVMEGVEQQADLERIRAFSPLALQGIAIAPPRLFLPAPDNSRGGMYEEDGDPIGNHLKLRRNRCAG